MNIDVDVNQVVMAKVAEAVLSQIGTESRNAILTKAVTNALTDYSFKRIIEQAVCDEAVRHASEMLTSAEWQERIQQVVGDAIERLVLKLPQAIESSVRDSLFGTGEQYGGHSRVLHYLSKERE